MRSIQFLILLCYFVYSAFSSDSFIKAGNRAELFELTDNKMPTIRINMSYDDVANLKDKATNFAVIDDYFLNSVHHLLEVSLHNIKQLNFHETFSNCNVELILPELKIGENGYPQFDEDEVMAGFDYNPEHYANENTQTIAIAFASSNKDFDLYSVILRIASLEISDFSKMDSVIKVLSSYEHLSKKEVSFFLYTFSEFKTKNATMSFELDGETQYFDKVTFSLSGQYSREFSKPGFNIKIKGGKELYDRSSIKLRADAIEPTYLRTKLMTDIHNRLGLKSISANYVQLYINDEYMGLYILTDSYKLRWAEKVYGEVNSRNLYKCVSMYDLGPRYAEDCENENEEVTDNPEWIEFLTTVENAKSADDLENIFEIDHFLYEMAIEYLVGGWDHIYSSHNFFLYKQPNGKWIYLSHDNDLDIGTLGVGTDELPYEDFLKKIHIMKILILDDPLRFEKILADVIERVFNPATLYPRIDELKKFLRPFVELDKTPNASGKLPGAINERGKISFSLEQWDAYSEFTPSLSDRYMYGLKQWILLKYRYVCQRYAMECEAVYLDDDYEYTIVERLAPSPSDLKQQNIVIGEGSICKEFPREPTFETITEEEEMTMPTESIDEEEEEGEEIITLPAEEDSSSDEELDFDEEEEITARFTITKTKFITSPTPIFN